MILLDTDVLIDIALDRRPHSGTDLGTPRPDRGWIGSCLYRMAYRVKLLLSRGPVSWRRERP